MAKFGGALYFETHSTFVVDNSSSLTLTNNEADLGGAVYNTDNSTVVFKESLLNIFLYDVIPKQHVTVLFYTTYVPTNKCLTAAFINNQAIQGGAIYTSNKSILQFKKSCLVIFIHNKVTDKGGALKCHDSSKILFEQKSCVTFN